MPRFYGVTNNGAAEDQPKNDAEIHAISLVILTGLISLLACIASWNINRQEKGYYSLFLLLVASMMGVFVALDLFLFYVFFEIMLLPMYFLIAIWGGENREYAAIKFLLFTLFGSVFILVSILILYFWPGDAAAISLTNATGQAQAFHGHSFAGARAGVRSVSGKAVVRGGLNHGFLVLAV